MNYREAIDDVQNIPERDDRDELLAKANQRTNLQVELYMQAIDADRHHSTRSMVQVLN